MSQVNHNYSYVYEIDGNTPWERLRIVRNFITDRTKALALAEQTLATTEQNRKYQNEVIKSLEEEYVLEELIFKEYEVEVSDCKETRIQLNLLQRRRILMKLANDIRKATNKLEKTQIQLQDHEALTQDCRDELGFLHEFEAKLVAICEPLRRDGATDREMYEINFPEEARVRMFMQFQAELIANQRVTVGLIESLRREPVVLTRLLEAGLVDIEFVKTMRSGLENTVHAAPTLLGPVVTEMLSKITNHDKQEQLDAPTTTQ